MTFRDVSPLARHYADYALAISNTKPFGTPASETPWYQEEGWPIREAAWRATARAIEDAMPEDWSPAAAAPAERAELGEGSE